MSQSEEFLFPQKWQRILWKHWESVSKYFLCNCLSPSSENLPPKKNHFSDPKLSNTLSIILLKIKIINHTIDDEEISVFHKILTSKFLMNIQSMIPSF
jgi:hypothetical protein